MVEFLSDGAVTLPAEDDAGVEVFNIKGQKVGENASQLTPGLYIIREGGVAKKVIVK